MDRARSRGSIAGAVLFAAVLGAVAVGGWLWLSHRGARHEAQEQRDVEAARRATADKWTSRLGLFLQKGPSGGTWVTRSLACKYTHYIAPHPRNPDALLIAQVDKVAKPPRAVSRWLVPRFFFCAPAHLFFSNYVRTDGPIGDELDDGTKCWLVHWGPRQNTGGLTERIVWFAQIGGEVVCVEDRARTGHLIRQVLRTSNDTGKWDPRDFDDADLEQVQSEPPDPAVDPDVLLSQLARKAPFDVYVPAYMPSGFVLVRSTFDVRDASTSPTGGGDNASTPVQLLSQLYSDGLGLISVGVALQRDMDVIEMQTGGMIESDSPTGCPGLPREPVDIRFKNSLVRMRTDTCRTVLRRDDLDGVSVTIIGRNELASDEYVRMMGTLERVSKGPAEKPKSGGDRTATDR